LESARPGAARRGRVRGAARTAIGLALVGAVLLGCGLGEERAPRSPTPGDRPADPAATADAAEAAREFERDLTAAVRVAERYWRAWFAQQGRPFTPIRRVIAYRSAGEVRCAGEPVPANNAVYCPAGDFIAYDVRWAARADRAIGDAFLYYLLGHEYAHGVQVRLGIRYRYTIAQELQADCLAGAYLGDSVRSGELRLEDGDLEEFRAGLAAVGDEPGQPWFAPGAHGSIAQRTSAFFTGYRSSVGACDLG